MMRLIRNWVSSAISLFFFAVLLSLSGCGLVQEYFPLPTPWDFPSLTPRPTQTGTVTPTPTVTSTYTPTEITPAQAGTSLNAPWTDIQPENIANLDLIVEAGKGIPQQMNAAPDGSLVAVATSNGVYLHDALTLDNILALYTGVIQHCVSVSSTGIIAAGDQQGKIKLWDISGDLLAVLPASTQPVLALAFSADSTLLTASTRDGSIGVWRLADQEKLQTLSVRFQPVERLAFSSDGALLYAWAPKESVQVWEVDSGQPLDEVYIAKDARGYLPVSGHFDQTGTLFAANYEGGVRILRMRNGTTLRQITDLQNPARAAVLSPDGSRLAALQQGSARVWDLETGALIADLMLPENDRILFLNFLADGQSLVTLGSSLQRWQIMEETPSEEALSPDVQSAYEYQTSITASSQVTSEEQLISLNADGSLQSYDLHQGMLSMLYPAQDGEFTSYALFTQDLAALGTQSGAIIITGSAGQQYTLNGAGNGPIRSLAFSRDGSLLASGGDDGSILVWSLSDQQIAYRLDQAEPPQALLFTPENELLVARSRSSIQVWSLVEEAQTLNLSGSGMALSGDGIILAAADPLANPAAIQLYRLPSGEAFSSVPLVGNELALSPDHMILAVAGRDLTLWNVIDGSLLQRVPELNISGSLQFSQDGKWIILTSWDGSTRVWGIPES